MQHVQFCCTLLSLPRLPKSTGPFEQHWLSNLDNLSGNKEIRTASVAMSVLPWEDHTLDFVSELHQCHSKLL